MRIESQAMRVAVNSRTVGSRSSNHIIPNPARSRIARRDTLRTLKGKDTESEEALERPTSSSQRYTHSQVAQIEKHFGYPFGINTILPITPPRPRNSCACRA
jgi:hypothetical protein